MRFIGHTMGTPGRTVYESIDAFRGIGFDGMELICRDGTDFDSHCDHARASRMADYAAYNDLPIVALTPYAWDINSADDETRRNARQELQRAIVLANLMRVQFVRAYGGREIHDEPEQAFERTVEALREAGTFAADKGITIVVENHMGTMTRTGKATRRLIDAVDMPAVRALYDPANVLFDTEEDYKTTFDVQADVIAYVHVKDFAMQGEERQAILVGEGVVPWREIVRKLVHSGYDGCFSFEYEKMWYPEQLPDAEEGMARCLETLKAMVKVEK